MHYGRILILASILCQSALTAAAQTIDSLPGLWTTGPASACPAHSYNWNISGSDVTFRDQAGHIDAERIMGTRADGFVTSTISSSSAPTSTQWDYRIVSYNSVEVRNLSTQKHFALTRCSTASGSSAALVVPSSGPANTVRTDPIGQSPSPVSPPASQGAVTHGAANAWQSNDFQDTRNPGCSIGATGSMPGSRLIMGASKTRPDPMSLVVRKVSWSIPAGTDVQFSATFPDGAVMQFSGKGNGQAVETTISANQLRPWLHELTAGNGMQLTFSGNETPWTFDLAGTTQVVNAMGDCFRAHQIAGVAPPFDVAATGGIDQPFDAPAAVATQPFSRGASSPNEQTSQVDQAASSTPFRTPLVPPPISPAPTHPSDTRPLQNTLDRLRSLGAPDQPSTSSAATLNAVQRGQIAEHIQPCWQAPISWTNPANFEVHLILKTNAAGVVVDSRVSPDDKNSYRDSPNYSSAANAARAALSPDVRRHNVTGIPSECTSNYRSDL